jgi:hypothetical protein
MIQSDAYYSQRLLEQIQTLQQRLSETVGSDAAITLRAQALAERMQTAIATADDSTLQSLFEITLLPSLDALLVDANYQLKLKKFAKTVTSSTEARHQQRHTAPALEAPEVPRYLPDPKPEYDESTKAKVEQALSLLKDFLRNE